MKLVYAAIYEHPDSTDVRIFASEDDTRAWRTRLAKESWHDAFDEDPPSDEDIGSEYFHRIAAQAEYFSMHPCELEGQADRHSPSLDRPRIGLGRSSTLKTKPAVPSPATSSLFGPPRLRTTPVARESSEAGFRTATRRSAPTRSRQKFAVPRCTIPGPMRR